jgi:cyclopropane fatty-acyl-phospholipid synthase-like methyltransferase
MSDEKKGSDRKVYDNSKELGDWYDRKYLEMGDGWNTPADEVNRHLDDIGVPFDKTKWLLDVGCGAGHFLQEAVKRVQCVGIELSRVGLEHCIKRAPEAYLSLGDIGRIPEVHLRPSYDYIVSIGSLEHIVDLPSALDNLRSMLKEDGHFYFYCPNELWMHFDQPNEQTKTDKDWIQLFAAHGLFTHRHTRWNDNTAFFGATYRQTMENIV